MKAYTKICCFIVMLAFFSGCTVFTGSETTKKDISGNDDHSNVNSHNDFVIYKITEDTIDLFVEKGEFALIKDEAVSLYVYSDSVPWYVSWNASRFIIKQELLGFIGDFSNLEKYLSRHGIVDNIETLAVFEAPNTPITIWVKTSNEKYFITINEKTNDKPYVYRFYTQKEYCEKYGSKRAGLIVKGKRVTSEYQASLYFKHAHIPFITVLQELGAKIDWKTETYAEIEYNLMDYFLDLTVPNFYMSGKENENLLYKIDGSPVCLYAYDKELMVDDITLQYVLQCMGEKVTVKLNENNLTVKVNVSLF